MPDDEIGKVIDGLNAALDGIDLSLQDIAGQVIRIRWLLSADCEETIGEADDAGQE